MSADVSDTLVLRFEGVSVAEAGKSATILRDLILDQCPEVQADLQKPDPTTQDFGTTLVLVLSAPVVVALAKGVAKGIANYLSRDRPGELVIETDGTVVFRGNSGDAATIANAVAKKTN